LPLNLRGSGYDEWARDVKHRLLGQRLVERLRRVGREATHLDLVARVRSKRHLYFGSTQVSSGGMEVATVDAALGVLPSLP
jgi:hypothetical protein